MAPKPSPALAADPVLAAIARAPVGPAETEEERSLVALAKLDGRFVSHAEVQAAIEERARRET